MAPQGQGFVGGTGSAHVRHSRWAPSWTGAKAEATRHLCPPESARSLAPAVSVGQGRKAQGTCLAPLPPPRDGVGLGPVVSWSSSLSLITMPGAHRTRTLRPAVTRRVRRVPVGPPQPFLASGGSPSTNLAQRTRAGKAAGHMPATCIARGLRAAGPQRSQLSAQPLLLRSPLLGGMEP